MRTFTCALFVLGALACTGIDAAAQPAATAPASSGVWTIDVHGGVITGADAVGGQGHLPPPGDPFTVGQLPSRRVPTWFFGDGPLLFNQMRTSPAPQQLPIPPMVPLDETLQRGPARRGAGGVFGARISRSLGDRLAIEFTADVHDHSLRFTDNVGPAVETTRTSYSAALSAIWQQPSAAFTDLTIVDDVGRELVLAGALNVRLTRTPRLESYATVGVGAARALGDAPSLTLVGHNRPASGNVVVINETDVLTVTVDPRPGAVIVIGGGFLTPIRGRSGVRIDARVHLIQDRTVTRVSATPSIESDIGIIVPRASNPTVVFSSSPVIPNSLSATLTDFATFTGRGTRTQTSLSAGYFFRF